MSSAFLYILLPSILVTSFISGIFGMAGGMIMMGIIAWFLPVNTAMVLHGFVQMTSNGWRAILHRKHIQWPIIKYYLPGLLCALAAFMLLQLVVNKAVLFIFLGAMPFLQYLLPKNAAMNIEKPKHAFLAGLVFSTLQLLCGVSGPIVDLFFVKSKLNRHQIIATKAVTQGFGHIMKIFYFGAVVALNEELPAALYITAFLAAMIGTTLSGFVLHRMTDQQFRQYSHGLIIVIALVYLGRGLSEYLG
jgi:uncharacterized membrane protein YfcA